LHTPRRAKAGWDGDGGGDEDGDGGGDGYGGQPKDPTPVANELSAL